MVLEDFTNASRETQVQMSLYTVIQLLQEHAGQNASREICSVYLGTIAV